MLTADLFSNSSSENLFLYNDFILFYHNVPFFATFLSSIFWNQNGIWLFRKESSTLARLTERDKTERFRAWVSSASYAVDTLVICYRQEQRLYDFQHHRLKVILNIMWKDCVSRSEVLPQANIARLFGLFRSLQWQHNAQFLSNGRYTKYLQFAKSSDPNCCELFALLPQHRCC